MNQSLWTSSGCREFSKKKEEMEWREVNECWSKRSSNLSKETSSVWTGRCLDGRRMYPGDPYKSFPTPMTQNVKH